MDIDLSIVLLYDLLDDRQAQPKPFMIHVCCTGQFPKSREQFSEVILRDTRTSVTDLALEQATLKIVG